MEGFRTNSAFGYQWKWSSINLMAGLGGEYRNHNIIDKQDSISENQFEITSNETHWTPHIELKIGIQL